METKRLQELWAMLHEKETEMFGIKAGEYASGDERLYNFKEGAKMMNCSAAQTAWAYLT